MGKIIFLNPRRIVFFFFFFSFETKEIEGILEIRLNFRLKSFILITYYLCIPPVSPAALPSFTMVPSKFSFDSSHAIMQFHMAFPSSHLLNLSNSSPYGPIRHPICHRGHSVIPSPAKSCPPQISIFSTRFEQEPTARPAATRRLCLVLPCTTTIGALRLVTHPHNIA